MSNSQPTVSQDEFDLLELLRGLRRQWLWLVICPAVLFVTAFIILHFVRPQYEGSMLLQVGQAGEAAPEGNHLIESPTAVASRVKEFAYLPGDLRDSNSPDAALFRKELTAVAVSDTNFVLVSSRGYDRKVLEAEMSALSGNIIQQHGVKLAHLADLNRADLTALQEDAKTASSFADRVGEAALKNGPKPGEDNVLTGLLLANATKDLREIKDRMRRVKAALDPTRTYNTSVISIEAKTRPISPQPAQILAVSVIFGVLIGGIIALGREYVRRHA